MGPFPTSINGNKYSFIMTEYLTRWCEEAALPDATPNSMAQALLQKVIFRHGCPQQLLSDQGSQFRSGVLQVLSHSLGIKKVLTSPYHPQTNGLTERMNKTIKHVICINRGIRFCPSLFTHTTPRSRRAPGSALSELFPNVRSMQLNASQRP